MVSVRSFRSRIFLTMLAVALVPATVALVTGAVVLREVVGGAGTAGPWEQVGISGQGLLTLLQEMENLPPEVEAQAQAHQTALAESARMSQVYAFVGDRFLALLPGFTALLLLVVLALSLWAARRLSRSFARPVNHLVDWTAQLARGEPLPPRESWEERGVREFSRLRGAFRTMDDQLRAARTREAEAQRLRNWTELARQVAHELKNPLTPMRLAALRVGQSTEAETAESRDILLQELERLDELARSFALFGRLPDGPRSPVDLGELLRDLARSEGGAPAVEVSADPELPLVMGHYDTLRRAVRNLLLNAREAQGVGGEAIRMVARRDEGQVVVEVLDRGTGLPEEEERIWDSDFTTKAGGSGLGLQLVLESIRAHGGQVEARNRTGGGAAFRIRLPIQGSR